MTAAKHQIKIVCYRKVARRRGDRLNDGFVGVVDKNHHMGKLDGRAPSHRHAGRDALQHRSLGGTHKRVGTLFIIIALKVDTAHKPAPYRTVGKRSLKQDHAVLMLDQHVAHIIAHACIDSGHPLLSLIQIHLGQDQI